MIDRKKFIMPTRTFSSWFSAGFCVSKHLDDERENNDTSLNPRELSLTRMYLERCGSLEIVAVRFCRQVFFYFQVDDGEQEEKRILSSTFELTEFRPRERSTRNCQAFGRVTQQPDFLGRLNLSSLSGIIDILEMLFLDSFIMSFDCSLSPLANPRPLTKCQNGFR